MRATRIAAAAYALVLAAAGAAGLWNAPLTWDERLYYAPAVRFFAAVLPRVPLDYAMPLPPLMLVVSGAIFRATGSIGCVRALSTLAAIATVALVAALVGECRRGALVVLAIGCFPPMLAYAFSLKQHWATLFFLTAAYVLWQRQRHAASAAMLVLAVCTNQIAVAFVLMIVVRQILQRRPFVAYLVPLLVLGAFVLYWRGPQPPMYRVAGAPHQPQFFHVVWAQLLLAAFETGVWIVPMIAGWWRRVLWALPIVPATAALFWKSAIVAAVRPNDPHFYERAVGPVTGALRAAAGAHGLSIAAAAVAAAAGCALFLLRRDDDVGQVQTYAITYAITMLPVPFFFESYYALFVLGSWLALARRLAGERSRLVGIAQVAAIVAGIGYALFRFHAP